MLPRIAEIKGVFDADTGALIGLINAAGGRVGSDQVFGLPSADSSTWADRGNGAYVGQTKRIDLSPLGSGYNPCVEVIWNGTRWAPRSGEQTIYDLPGVVTSGAAALTAALAVPSVIVPGGMMSPNGEIEVASAAYLTTFAGTLSARVLTMGWGGSSNNLLNDTVNLHRRVSLFRHIKNAGVSNQQVIIQRAANEFQEAVSANTDPQTTTQDTTIDRTIQASYSWTSSANIVAALIKHRVVWRDI